MFRFLIVTFLFATAYGGALPAKDARIIGGEAADINEAPYQVAMLFLMNPNTLTQVCGGSIISPTIIVTAAHCAQIENAALWKVRAGSRLSMSGGQLIDVSRIIIHEIYNSATHDHDISLFILVREISIDSINTRVIELASQGSDVAAGTPAIITGWGSTSEGGSTVSALQIVTSHITNQQDCINAYSSTQQITARMICTGNFVSGGEAACEGDFGGPLVVNNVLVGVGSWSVGCGRLGFPGVWSSIPALRNWIDQHKSIL